MKKTALFILALAAAAVLSASCAGSGSKAAEEQTRSITAGENTRMKTTYGTIEGYLDGDVYTFKGIQYAKADRFMPPQDPDVFEGVRMCKIYGPKAPQSESLVWRDNTQTDYAVGNNFVMEPMDEKGCLVLNVWTKGLNDGKKRPVFVWIHGGGFSTGSGHDLPCYEGYSLAKKGDIVFVNLNHRLNVLGYVDLSGLGGKYAESVNLGMQDIVKALEWIHKNIEKFGGDPAQVTIGGQSGGGGKVSTLLAMPSAKGLFQKAVIQSGSGLRIGEGADAREYGLAFVEALGAKPSANVDLSGYTYEQLVAAGRTASQKLAAKGKRGGAGPCVDGKIVPTQLFDPVAPEVSKDVPMLVGTNFNEFSFDINSDLSEKDIVAKLEERYGKERAAEFVDCFKATYPDLKPSDMLFADMRFRLTALQQCASKARQGGAKVYNYLFNWRPTENALGASHGMELPFMFNNVSLQREMTGGSARAYKLQEKISDAWLAFIKTGDPNTPSLPAWDAFTEDNGATMVLDDVCVLKNDLDKQLLEIANRQ